MGITGIEAIGAPSADGDSIEHLPLNSDEVSVAYDRNTIRLTFNVADVAQAPFTEYAYCVEEFGNAQWLQATGPQKHSRNRPMGCLREKQNCQTFYGTH